MPMSIPDVDESAMLREALVNVATPDVGKMLSTMFG